jgi:molybdopterin converting factor small subunit
MEIRVEFFAYLANYSPDGEKKVTLSVDEGITLKDLWDRLRIPFNVEKICLVNGSYYSEEKTLQQGDVVSIYPMVDGG